MKARKIAEIALSAQLRSMNYELRSALYLGSLPLRSTATCAALPAMSLIPVAPLKLVRYPSSLAPTLVALPSMSLIPVAPFAEASAYACFGVTYLHQITAWQAGRR